jgi:hypothetical protein
MRFTLVVALWLLFPAMGNCQTESFTKSDLHVVYLGRETDDERQAAYTEFLEQHFSTVTSIKRSDFDHNKKLDADVLLLDWSQQEDREENYPSPLGKLETWSTPTVLLGSAGLLISGPWKIPGGAG